MSAEEAYQLVIKPMMATLPPPTHLRGNDEGMKAALEVYVRALSRFDAAALRQGWQKAAQENAYWAWPKASTLVAACDHFARQSRNGSEHDALVQKAEDMAWQYTRRFMKSSGQAGQARAEGWERELKAYVRAAATVQAGLIVGVPHHGYDSYTLFGRARGEDLAAMREAFFERARAQAEKGHVRVHVPPSLVERWREGCRQGRGRG
jgi:hypothetical protein